MREEGPSRMWGGGLTRGRGGVPHARGGGPSLFLLGVFSKYFAHTFMTFLTIYSLLHIDPEITPPRDRPPPFCVCDPSLTRQGPPSLTHEGPHLSLTRKSSTDCNGGYHSAVCSRVSQMGVCRVALIRWCVAAVGSPAAVAAVFKRALGIHGRQDGAIRSHTPPSSVHDDHFLFT